MDEIKDCINILKKANNGYSFYDLNEFDTFRSLMNVTMPYDLPDEYYIKQDIVLQEIKKNRTIIDVNDLPILRDKVCLVIADITTLKVDAVVNACNNELLGCFNPLHKCVDNAIHSYAGLEVRRDLMYIMAKQGYLEPNGRVKVTKGYNLDAKYIFHTVGPIINGEPTEEDEEDLASCYISCLNKADELQLESIAFSCISTGIYGYDIYEASCVAVRSVHFWVKDHPNTSIKRIIFDTFSKKDYDAYAILFEE